MALYAKFVRPQSGYSHDGEKALNDGLIVGNRYEVKDISMGQYHTLIYLVGFGCYNSA